MSGYPIRFNIFPYRSDNIRSIRSNGYHILAISFSFPLLWEGYIHISSICIQESSKYTCSLHHHDHNGSGVPLSIRTYRFHSYHAGKGWRGLYTPFPRKTIFPFPTSKSDEAKFSLPFDIIHFPFLKASVSLASGYPYFAVLICLTYKTAHLTLQNLTGSVPPIHKVKCWKNGFIHTAVSNTVSA